MKAWSTIQSGLEQQDPTTWSEIMRQPLFGNMFLTNEEGVKWGTTPRSHMLWWAKKEYRSLQDIARHDGHGWRTFPELFRLRRTTVAPTLYNRVVNSIPWEAYPMPANVPGQWVAPKSANGSINQVYHIQQENPITASLYTTDSTDNLQLAERHQQLPAGCREVRVVRTGGPKRYVLDYNPTEQVEEDQLLWLWGKGWISDLEWDPKEWLWRRIGILPETTVLNYSTKRGYRVALRQDNHQMPLDAELEATGFNGKTRAKFFIKYGTRTFPEKFPPCNGLFSRKASQWVHGENK